ncbi:uncharacterized protein LOC117327128 isoform X1 [Pecten maximus]|uniref:uncharacterized protein LOC117327128 isoform X1 n=1 Tax=Pecten maximus TaxID=6579 RepID=UPI001458C5B5|nr:uncharacterized protein LOC117327128 isoform X1 [Pecten maximus]XP_033739865.1 uncharacterized protein LOC117327128 isoform X1 [Pecten maximus]
MATKQVVTENEEEAIGAQNELALHLDDGLKEEEFVKLKNLFRGCPLTSRQHENIKTMADLFQHLEKDQKIFVGNYEFFTEKLEKVHPKLATEVRRREKQILDILNGGPSPAKQQGTGDETQQQPPGLLLTHLVQRTN